MSKKFYDLTLWLTHGVVRRVALVVVMIVVYLIAHVVLTRTLFGRYVYAIGGNEEATRLSGVRVMSVYVPNNSSYTTTVSGVHRGCLSGTGPDFDLYLQKRSGSS